MIIFTGKLSTHQRHECLELQAGDLCSDMFPDTIGNESLLFLHATA